MVLYSGISQPIRTLSNSQTYTVTSTAPNDVTQTQDINLTDNGIIQGFLASVNVASISGLANRTLTCKLKRNGQTLFTQSTNVGEWTASTGLTKGIIFYETLNILSGAEIAAGEALTLELTYYADAGTIVYNSTINVILKANPRQLIG